MDFLWLRSLFLTDTVCHDNWANQILLDILYLYLTIYFH